MAAGAALMRAMSTVLIVIFVMATAAKAQTELSFYGGALAASDSRIHGSDPGSVGGFDFLASWGEGSDAVPNYGVRLTWWQSAAWAWSLDFSHDSFTADAMTLSDNGLSMLGFSQGLNVLTVNRIRQWDDHKRPVVPYLGAGLGVSLPALEFAAGGGAVSEIQIGGPAVSVIAGARYPMGDRWSVFGEYKGTISANSLDLPGDGNLRAGVITNALNLGASFGF